MFRFASSPTSFLRAVFGLAVIGLAAGAPGAAKATSTLAAGFGPAGLSSLTWQSATTVDLLSSGAVELQDLKLANGDVNGAEFSSTGSHFDPSTHTLFVQFSWGTVRVKYQPEPAGNALRTTVSVINNGSKAVTRFGVYLLRWKLPAKAVGGWNGADILLSDRQDEIPIVTVPFETGRLVVCNEDLSEPATFGIQPLDKGAEAVLLRFDDKKPILPGSSRRVTLSIRVAAADEPMKAFVGDILQAFATRYPSELKWADHRPIGSAFLATSVAGYKNNPRGWFLDPNLDVNTVAGREAFAQQLSKYVDSVISHCRNMNAQGVLVWDLEGQEMPHATSYIADPRVLSHVAPEMEPLADPMFRKFASAGLRTGVTIRPTRVVRSDHGPGWMQQDVADPVAEMDSKITYAHRRWGCTIFYIDSNVNFTRDPNGTIVTDPPMLASDFQKLARLHPDCLLMPEHKTAAYWAYTAPYAEFRQGFTGTPEAVRIAYPHAFSLMQVVDGPSLSAPDNVKTLTAAIDQGDILLFRPWWDDPQTKDIEQLYVHARSGPSKAF